MACLRGTSGTFIVPAFALTERVTSRPTALEDAAGLDIPTFAVVVVVVAVVVVALVGLLIDALATVRPTIFRVVFLSLVGRAALALVVIFRGAKLWLDRKGRLHHLRDLLVSVKDPSWT